MTNTRKIGTKFEAEAFEILKKKFDKVEWLSKKNPNSTFNFKCIDDGKKLFAEAKYVSKSNQTPKLSFYQKDADIVLCKKKDKIYFYKKPEIPLNCSIGSLPEKVSRKGLPKNVFVIQRWGGSRVIILSSKFIKSKKLKAGDWVDISDIVKIKEPVEGVEFENEH